MKRLIQRMLFVFCLGLVISPAWGKVTVTRDKYGIPSIQADTEEEVFEAFGYEVAVDRLWQMEINRRMAWGTLAEILGPKLVPMDMQTRMMCYTEEEYDAIFKRIPADLQKLISAYIRGINKRIDEVIKDPTKLPFEYLAVKLKPEHYREIDSLSFLSALYRIFGVRGGDELKNLSTLQTLMKRFGQRDGWEIFNDWTWISDPASPTYIDQKIRGDYLPGRSASSALPSYFQNTPDVIDLALDAEKMYSAALDEARLIGAPVRPGSYAWTLSAKVTGTGYPILVGNVQAQHGSVPSIIHEIQLKGGRFNVVGASVPLLPYIFAGHTHHTAWSIMVGMVDNIDIYQEVLNPLNREEYLFRGSWRKMDKRTDKIKIAGGKVEEVTIYSTIHGPIYSPFPFDPEKANSNLAYTRKVSWSKTEDMLAGSMLKISLAKNAKEFGEAMSFHTPTVHYVFADIEGNIGYWHNGLNPERTGGFDPRLPLPGTGEAEWTGRYLPNSHVMNPSKGYVTGWNNKASPDMRNPFDVSPNHYYGKFNRALWLDKVIVGRNDLDRAGNEEIMRFIGGVGVYSSNDENGVGYTAKWLVPFLKQAIDKAGEEERPIFNQILEILVAWDGRSVTDAENDDKFQAGQTIYLDWLPRLLKVIFADELEGIEEFKETHSRIVNLLLRCVDGSTSNLPVSKDYFDNINTSEKETMEDMFLQSLRETVVHLKETFKSDDPAAWKAPRTKIIYRHPMFGQLAEMWDNNVGTYPMIVELRPEGAIGFSRFHLGESGNIAAGADNKPVFDPHFFDMQPLFKSYAHQKMGLD